MVDPETVIMKAGAIVLLCIAIVRLVVHEFRNLRDDLFGKRRRQ